MPASVVSSSTYQLPDFALFLGVLMYAAKRTVLSRLRKAALSWDAARFTAWDLFIALFIITIAPVNIPIKINITVMPTINSIKVVPLSRLIRSRNRAARELPGQRPARVVAALVVRDAQDLTGSPSWT